LILGGLGYYIFIYEPADPTELTKETQISEEQKLRDEYGVEEKTYQGALVETYNKAKDTINSAKESVSLIEKKSRETSEI